MGTEHGFIPILLLSLGLLLWTARFLGELARKFGQPPVLGEILAGVLLGPTVLGRIFPGAHALLFPSQGAVASFFAGFDSLAALLLLFVAGFEIRIFRIRENWPKALSISALGVLFPFILGGAIAWKWPEALGLEPGMDPAIFAMFIATAMSISALPVIARALMDMGLYQTRVGVLVMSAAVLDDIVGWIIFSGVLAAASHRELSFSSTGRVIALALVFALVMLTLGSALFKRILPWLRSWTKKTLSYCLGIAIFAGAFTSWLGIHALFGAFIAGAAIGSTDQFDEETASTVSRFVNSFFTPIFFAGLALKSDFIADFRPMLVLLVFVIACVGKILGCGIASYAAGLPARESLSIGIAMNTRGAMEIIMGGIALNEGVIGKPVFVALVLMALATSAMVGLLRRSHHPE